MRRKEAKVALDSRFMAPMLTDPMFDSSAAPVDKRGRRRKKSARDRENPMLHYYLSQEEGDEEKTEQEKLICQEEDHEVEEEDGLEEEESSSSDGEEDGDDQYSVGCDIAHYLLAGHDDTPVIDKETHRLAVVNMDWDHIKAVDLYMVMTSCIPEGGRVVSVSIYPTEFGLKCMNIEATQGPSALIGADGDGDGDEDGEDDNNDDDNDDDDDGEEDSDLDYETENNKLRTYELNKLRYYYAVVVCDCSTTADHLYTTLDGTEFLKTANVFHLQFIDDSKEFKYPARDVATEAPLSYKAPDFETPALQRTKVKSTWDDDEPERKILRQKFKHEFDGYGKYIASGDSASEDGVDDSGDESLPNGVAKRKLTNEERLARLLQQGNKSDEEQTDDEDMEITFNTGLEDLSKRILERKSTETKTVLEMHQEKMKEKRKAGKRWSKDDDGCSDQDSADDFLDDEKSDEEVKAIKKPKVKKAKGGGKDESREEHYEPEATKEELELLVAAGQDAANGAKGYNIKRKSKKGKKGKDNVEDKLGEIDVSKDERLSPMFTSHQYALDPTDPRRAALVRKQAGKKRARVGTLDSEPRMEPQDDASPNKANWKRDTENLQMLSAVSSLKRNLAAFIHSV
ncbi:pre-rRNA-processing protein esf1-like isoform X1 [Triticum dicoccoides]|uniref:pre-rRNA-processing protein esf1-like isoform X1 n=1 Tax=Triticum dicoccoides TaxID=85692 RepID=UPI001891DBA5|nr:pre-rRNA-processing protein esf1-like isoform X1 [Triticum dicoccoides]